MSLTIIANRLDGTQRIHENVQEEWFNEKEVAFLNDHDVRIISEQTVKADYDLGIDDTWIFKVYVDNNLVWEDWSGSYDYATSYIEEEVMSRI